MKKVIISLIAILLSLSMFISTSVFINAHEEVCEVDFDECDPEVNSKGEIIINYDGEGEMWFYTKRPAINFFGLVVDLEYHIDHEIQTIKYYFEPTSFLSSYTWTTDIYKEYIKTMSHEDAMIQAEITASEIKEAYAESMKKWNNVYYYSYDNEGNRISHKIINIVEGTEQDHNLSIYPIDNYTAQNQCPIELWRDTNYYACCGVANFPNNIPSFEEGVIHTHFDDWFMYVNVNYFYTHGKITGASPAYDVDEVRATEVRKVRERTGMHEIGHILGLGDVDSICDAVLETDASGNVTEVEHHEELLMGYGNQRAENISYKDIAGVAITRGFHTDDDHVWMLRTNSDGTKDVICAQCNGVRYNISLTDGKYEGKDVKAYESCIHHGGANEQMLLVATDGERNFFKCQYCRHIETVDLSKKISVSKYTPVSLSDNLLYAGYEYYKLTVDKVTLYTLNITPHSGLSAKMYDENLNSIDFVTDAVFTDEGSKGYLNPGTYYLRIDNSSSASFDITISPPTHVHEYTEWVCYSSTRHIEACECGEIGTVKSVHVVAPVGLAERMAPCIDCGTMVDISDTHFPSIMSITKYSVNGSYILPNGIIVLVEEDVEVYLNGTLVFYDKDNLPVTE